jgi:hypothetical protein
MEKVFTPYSSTNPARIHGFNVTLVAAMLNTINATEVPRDTMARQHHQMIIGRFFQVLDAHPVESLNMQALSKEIGVSGRTFRMACREQPG